MVQREYSTPLSLRTVRIQDDFWDRQLQLVRQEIIPYQWRALNDQIPEAEPSYCIRNFQVAAKQNRERREKRESFVEPSYTFRGFQTLPEDRGHLEDTFYGFVFQDSDLYKWLEAVAYSLVVHPDEQLEYLADSAVQMICEAQQEDGYLDTYYSINGKDRIFSNLRDHHELYCFGHLAEAAVAYYEATGKTRLLQAAERFADYIDARFGPEEGKCKGYPGHEIAEMALIRLYQVTGKDKYKELSRFFVEERGKKPCYFDLEGHPEETNYPYYQAHLPVREQKEAVGHAVRAVYLYSGMADLARVYQDDSLYQACCRLWHSIVNEKMYITGAIGATHIGESFSFPYDLPNDTVYGETCASIGLIFFARRMLQIKPMSQYGDVMERALYNTVLSGMALDGKSFFYVNPLEAVPEACRRDERKAHVKPVRQKWFGCACCPPNLARLLGSVASYAFTEREDVLWIHLYLGAKLEKQVGQETVRLSIESGFPWDGKVRIQIREGTGTFAIALRLPQWCENYELQEDADASRWEKDGYLYLEKQWEKGDRIAIDFPMEIQRLEADARVRENAGQLAIQRGPVVYCLEEQDNGKDLHLLKAGLDSQARLTDMEVGGVSVKAILLEGTRQSSSQDDGMSESDSINSRGLYHIWKKKREEEQTLRFIPYFTWGNRGENEMRVWVRY